MSGQAPHRLLRSRPARFLVVGVGAAGLLFALSFALVSLGLKPFAASVIAYAVAFVTAYTAQRNWTFGAAQAHGVALPRYLAVQLGCALLAGATSHVCVEWLGASHAAMSATTTVLASAASYVLSSRWVFAPAARQRA